MQILKSKKVFKAIILSLIIGLSTGFILSISIAITAISTKSAFDFIDMSSYNHTALAMSTPIIFNDTSVSDKVKELKEELETKYGDKFKGIQMKNYCLDANIVSDKSAPKTRVYSYNSNMYKSSDLYCVTNGKKLETYSGNNIPVYVSEQIHIEIGQVFDLTVKSDILVNDESETKVLTCEVVGYVPFFSQLGEANKQISSGIIIKDLEELVPLSFFKEGYKRSIIKHEYLFLNYDRTSIDFQNNLSEEYHEYKNIIEKYAIFDSVAYSDAANFGSVLSSYEGINIWGIALIIACFASVIVYAFIISKDIYSVVGALAVPIISFLSVFLVFIFFDAAKSRISMYGDDFYLLMAELCLIMEAIFVGIILAKYWLSKRSNFSGKAMLKSEKASEASAENTVEEKSEVIPEEKSEEKTDDIV